MNYPTNEQVLKANQEQLAKWYRFLPSPKNEEESKIMKSICESFKGFNSTLSKKVGW